MKSSLIRKSLIGLLVLLPSLSTAIDIDIYLDGTGGSDIPPNILFIFDNTANWNSNSGSVQKRVIEHEAIYRFVDAIWVRNSDAIPANDVSVNLAIMGATHGNSPPGGKPLYYFAPIRPENKASNFPHIQEIRRLLYCDSVALKTADYDACKLAVAGADGNTVNFDTFKTWVDAQPANTQGDIWKGALPTANKAKYATSFLEAYHWFAGNNALAGKQDDDNGGSDGIDAKGQLAYDFNAFDVVSGKYDSPIERMYDPDTGDEVESCAKNHIVFLGNGAPSSGENGTAETALGSSPLNGNTELIQIPKWDNYESNWADEYARYLANADVHDALGKQSITTHVIDVFDPTANMTSPEKAAHALLEMIAVQGEGEYIQASDVDSLVKSLLDVLNSILAINDVFAASALPVSVNVRGTNLNQVYIGVFRPDGQGKPRWAGNMKMYRLGLNTTTGEVFLEDADGTKAANDSTGFIKSDARSFWTATSNFWHYLDGTVPDDAGGASDSPDGDVVEKGAIAQSIREDLLNPLTTRKIYTCQGCTSNLDSFDNTITPAEFGIDGAFLSLAYPVPLIPETDINFRNRLVRWVTGYNVHHDVDDDDLEIASAEGAVTPADVRASVHGDVLHSRPAVINYGDTDGDGNENVYVFYGSNDGMLHAIVGGTDESVNSNNGKELWSFIPEEHLPDLKSLYLNAPLAEMVDKPFFIDGVIGSYIEMTGATASKVHIYLTMRRGGDFIYALDVTNPKVPKFLWKKSSASADYAELGQTWSAPLVSTLKLASGDTPVLIFGLGYDELANDGNIGRNVLAAKGRGIAVVDAITGAMIWQAGPTGSADFVEPEMKYAVSADLTVLDRDRNGYSDRAYFGDTGGQLWRADIFDPDPTNWKVTKLFELEDGQKFLTAPDAAASTDPADPFDAVVITSGDRENPTGYVSGEEATNYIIVLKDKDVTVSNSSRSTADAYTLTELADASNSADLENDPNKNIGWYIELDDEEQGISKPAIVNSIVFLNTFLPAQLGICSGGVGVARAYSFDFMTSKAVSDMGADGVIDDSDRFDDVVGGGLIPDPVPVIVDIGGELVEAIISGTQVQQFPNTLLQKRQQTYWLKDIDE